MSETRNAPMRRASMAAEDAATQRAALGLPPPSDQAVTTDAAAEEPRPQRRARPGRRPFGAREQKLAYPNRTGYHRHWFNDEPGRIIRAEDAGYSKVADAGGKPVSTVVGTARGGGALVAFLMEIPIEWYQEDRETEEALVHDLMGQIRQGEHAKPQGRDGDLRYAGSTRGDIAIREGDRR